MTLRASCVLAALLVIAALPVAAQVSEAPAEVVAGFFDKAAEVSGMRSLNARLLEGEAGALVPKMTIAIGEEQLAELRNAPTNQGRMLVGINAPVSHAVRFSALDAVLPGKAIQSQAGGNLRLTGDGFIWNTVIDVAGATATRLHLRELSLPTGGELYVYNQHGEAFGPYTEKGVMGDGDFWTHTVAGSEIRLQVRYTGPQVMRALRATRFVIAEAVHLGESFLFAKVTNPAAVGIDVNSPAGKAFCSFNASCINNASCQTLPGAIQPVRNAIAHLQFPVGAQTFICTGGLLNDTDASTTIPYFLTANHCFDTQTSASGLEAFFQFSTGCGGTCFNPNGVSPRVLGATLLATNPTSDFTFLRLNGSAPAGSTLLGWTASAVAFSNGTNLFRISHPKGAPQAYSTQNVSTSAGTCGSLPRGNFIYSRDTSGATEGGSSGSPVVNASAQVVGQLFGACGSNLGNVCDSNSNATVDGAFATTFAQVEQFLDPNTGGGCHPDVLGGFGYCTNSCTCSDGEGDCDSDAQCNAGLVCGTDNGPQFGFGSLVDVCVPPGDCHPDVLGGFGYCTNSCTCANGEGDCDSNAQCDAGLICGTDNGPQFGFGSAVDVCVPQPANDPNSCSGNCGTQAPGGCWCDSQCSSFGDCCADKVQICG